MHFDETSKTTKFKKTLLGVKNNFWTTYEHKFFK